MKSLREQTIATFNNILIPVTLTFLSNYPELQVSIIIAYGFFGISMQYKQEEFNEYIKIFIENPNVLSSEVVKTKEFSDGNILILESYIKERNKYKRNKIKNILLNFAVLSKEDKKEFELEKMLDVINKISINELLVLNIYLGKLDRFNSQGTKNKYKEFVKGTDISNYDLHNFVKLSGVGEEVNLVNIDEIIKGLVNLNLIIELGSTLTFSGTINTRISLFGKKFISYVLEDEKA